MLKNILSTIICYTFDDLIDRMQGQRYLKGEPMYCMEITFKLYEKHNGDSLYPSVQLLIFGECNYVQVMYRESETRDEYGEWQHLSCHDSCWKGDGVDRFLLLYQDRIAVLDWHGGICNNKWYLKREVSKDEVVEWREIRRASER